MRQTPAPLTRSSISPVLGRIHIVSFLFIFTHIMDDSIPSLSAGAVGSRFVSQEELDTAKARREEQWKAAYARLGQEPPPQPAEDVFDGRSLAEKLAANRAAKQEEWEERNKLGNQFRALEEDEVLFLDSLAEKQREEERLRKEMEGEELKNFRQAVAARENALKPPPLATEASTAPPANKGKSTASAPVKRDSKKTLKGVLVKKKPKAAEAKSSADGKGSIDMKSSTGANTSTDVKPSTNAKGRTDTKSHVSLADRSSADDVGKPPAKRRKVENPTS
ncbi:hypothetical protein NM688_g6654 [Phlebia brevispora]|uniref:Uncharacterized protein n=1 Tax=Phlebia brevispora TaxID=194682 RepID=A0ACC1SDW9_9APHY|nr:hypothetical protein NM688_g6654 [Phlebia brevispora]